MTANVGTVQWCAPEMLSDDTASSYGTAVDVYSFGIVAWEVFSGAVPFANSNLTTMQLMLRIGTGKLTPTPVDSLSTPPQVVELYKRCWSFNPSDRPAINDALDVLLPLMSQQSASKDSINDDDDDSNDCVVCTDAKRDVVLVPCGHVALCQKCAGSLLVKKCPICSSAITQVVKQFHA